MLFSTEKSIEYDFHIFSEDAGVCAIGHFIHIYTIWVYSRQIPPPADRNGLVQRAMDDSDPRLRRVAQNVSQGLSIVQVIRNDPGQRTQSSEQGPPQGRERSQQDNPSDEMFFTELESCGTAE